MKGKINFKNKNVNSNSIIFNSQAEKKFITMNNETTNTQNFSKDLTENLKDSSLNLHSLNNKKLYSIINPTCKFCYEKEKKNDPLIIPCKCEGTIKYVHQSCLKKWLIKSKIRPELSRCEICKDKYYIRYYKDKKIDKNAYKRFVLYIFCLIIGMVFILCFFIICLYHVVFDEKNIKKKTKIIYFIISIFISIIVLSTSSLIVICCFRKKCSEKVFENFEIIDKSYYDCSSISKTISKHIGSIKNIQINNFVLK